MGSDQCFMLFFFVPWCLRVGHCVGLGVGASVVNLGEKRVEDAGKDFKFSPAVPREEFTAKMGEQRLFSNLLVLIRS